MNQQPQCMQDTAQCFAVDGVHIFKKLMHLFYAWCIFRLFF